MADTVGLTVANLRRFDAKLDDVRADLDELRAASRGLEDRRLAVERAIGLVREGMARRDRRSDARAGRVKRIERRPRRRAGALTAGRRRLLRIVHGWPHRCGHRCPLDR